MAPRSVKLPRRAVDRHSAHLARLPDAGQLPRGNELVGKPASGRHRFDAGCATLDTSCNFPCTRSHPMEIAVLLFIIAAAIFIIRVPSRWCRSRTPGWSSAWGSTTRLAGARPELSWCPFIDKVAYKHSLKEIPLDVPSQVCITRDNTQLQVDGILYFPSDRPDARELRFFQLHRRCDPARSNFAALRHRQTGARQDLRGARHHQRAGGAGDRRGRRSTGVSRCCATRSRT